MLTYLLHAILATQWALGIRLSQFEKKTKSPTLAPTTRPTFAKQSFMYYDTKERAALCYEFHLKPGPGKELGSWQWNWFQNSFAHKCIGEYGLLTYLTKRGKAQPTKFAHPTKWCSDCETQIVGGWVGGEKEVDFTEFAPAGPVLETFKLANITDDTYNRLDDALSGCQPMGYTWYEAFSQEWNNHLSPGLEMHVYAKLPKDPVTGAYWDPLGYAYEVENYAALLRPTNGGLMYHSYLWVLDECVTVPVSFKGETDRWMCMGAWEKSWNSINNFYNGQQSDGACHWAACECYNLEDTCRTYMTDQMKNLAFNYDNGHEGAGSCLTPARTFPSPTHAPPAR